MVIIMIIITMITTIYSTVPLMKKKQYGNMNSKNKKRKIKILLAHFSSESITGTDSDAYLADRSDRPRSRRQAPNAKENKIKHVILR